MKRFKTLAFFLLILACFFLPQASADCVRGTYTPSGPTCSGGSGFLSDGNIVSAYYMNGTANEPSRVGSWNDMVEFGTIPRSTNVPPNYSGYSRAFDSGDLLYSTPRSEGSWHICGASQAISLAVWFRTTDLTNDEVLMAKSGTLGDSETMFQLYVNSSDDQLRGVISSDGSTLTTAIGGTTLSENTWYHVALVYDNTDIRLYLNGYLDTNGTDNPKSYSSGIYCNNDAVYGTGGYFGKLNPTYFAGDMDEGVLFNDALSAAEVLELYNNGISGNCGASD